MSRGILLGVEPGPDVAAEVFSTVWIGTLPTSLGNPDGGGSGPRCAIGEATRTDGPSAGRGTLRIRTVRLLSATWSTLRPVRRHRRDDAVPSRLALRWARSAIVLGVMVIGVRPMAAQECNRPRRGFRMTGILASSTRPRTGRANPTIVQLPLAAGLESQPRGRRAHAASPGRNAQQPGGHLHLLSAGADPNAMDNDRCTPLTIRCRTERKRARGHEPDGGGSGSAGLE